MQPEDELIQHSTTAGSATVYDAEELFSIRLDNKKLRRKYCSRKRTCASNR
jgi:hypothetical protein